MVTASENKHTESAESIQVYLQEIGQVPLFGKADSISDLVTTEKHCPVRISENQ